MNKRSNTPKRKRLTKKARLDSALSWIKKYNGKNIISGYAKWFGVNKMCAINELKIIGVEISETLVNQIKASTKARIEQKRILQEKRQNDENIFIESDENFAYIIGYTSGGFPYGLTHDEMKIIESENED